MAVSPERSLNLLRQHWQLLMSVVTALLLFVHTLTQVFTCVLMVAWVDVV